jgi:hypothetical protein
MSRVPASLLYLAVYNTTLKPSGSIPDGDEDAEEQAQILFYTSRERAVSRDRMLRQVGLAKALVSFTECVRSGRRINREDLIIGSQDVQSRRRTMRECALADEADGRDISGT